MREHEWTEIEEGTLSGSRCAIEDAANGANKPSSG